MTKISQSVSKRMSNKPDGLMKSYAKNLIRKSKRCNKYVSTSLCAKKIIKSFFKINSIKELICCYYPIIPTPILKKVKFNRLRRAYLKFIKQINKIKAQIQFRIMQIVDDDTLLIVDNQRKIQALKFFKPFEEYRIMQTELHELQRSWNATQSNYS